MRTLIMAAVAATLCACAAPTTAPEDPATSTTPAAHNRCQPVSEDALERIADGANDTPIRPVSGSAVKSTDFDSVYMVAMTFTIGQGDEQQIGVWAVAGGLDDVDGIRGVDGFADEFTVWPGEGMSQSDDGVDAARACERR